MEDNTMTRRHPRNKQVIRAAIAAAILAAAIFPAASSAEVKDYYFPEVRIEAAVNRDGSFLIDEFRTFEFQGEFRYAYVVIPLRVGRLGVLRDVAISDFAVTDEQGRALFPQWVDLKIVLPVGSDYDVQ